MMKSQKFVVVSKKNVLNQYANRKAYEVKLKQEEEFLENMTQQIKDNSNRKLKLVFVIINLKFSKRKNG